MTAVYIAAYVLGLYYVIELVMEFTEFSGEYFYHYGRKNNVRPLWQKAILKPLYYCSPCMCSVHGTLCYFVLLGGSDIGTWIWSCVVASGLLVLVNRILNWKQI